MSSPLGRHEITRRRLLAAIAAVAGGAILVEPTEARRRPHRPTPTPIPPTAAPPPPGNLPAVWKHLAIVPTNYAVPGLPAYAMPDSEIVPNQNDADALAGHVADASGGMCQLDATTVVTDIAVTQAEDASGQGDYWVAPWDAPDIRAAFGADGDDSVVILTAREGIPDRYSGWTVGGNPGWSDVMAGPPGWDGWPSAMGIMHEWVWQVVHSFGGAGYPMPNPDQAANYTDLSGADYTDSGDGWYHFLSDILQGKVVEKATGNVIGCTAAVWASGKPVT